MQTDQTKNQNRATTPKFPQTETEQLTPVSYFSTVLPPHHQRVTWTWQSFSFCFWLFQPFSAYKHQPLLLTLLQHIIKLCLVGTSISYPWIANRNQLNYIAMVSSFGSTKVLKSGGYLILNSVSGLDLALLEMIHQDLWLLVTISLNSTVLDHSLSICSLKILLNWCN